MKRCKFYKLQFHKWQYLASSFEDSYMGEQFTRYYRSHRYCTKCKLAQEQKYTSQGFYWDDLLPQEAEILFKNIDKFKKE